MEQLNEGQKKCLWESLRKTVDYYMSKNLAGEHNTSFAFLAVAEEADRIFNRAYREERKNEG